MPGLQVCNTGESKFVRYFQNFTWIPISRREIVHPGQLKPYTKCQSLPPGLEVVAFFSFQRYRP